MEAVVLPLGNYWRGGDAEPLYRDKLIKFTDASIFWQVELSDFAENIKKQINPKFWELGKEL
jgi:hypothetical protein